jgi:hypothetical protein
MLQMPITFFPLVPTPQSAIEGSSISQAFFKWFKNSVKIATFVANYIYEKRSEKNS